MLILVPSRELCKQVAGSILSLSVSMDVALLYPGPENASQEQLVRLGARVIVATPGRFASVMRRGAINPKSVRILVIDEADAMLGFEHFGLVERVLKAVAKDRLQSVLFSASLPPSVVRTIEEHFKDYQSIDLVDRGGIQGVATVESVEHWICCVSKSRNERARVLLHLLAANMDERGGQCIVFVDSTAEAKLLLSHPVMDRQARGLHGETTSLERDAVITAFANQEFEVLITTDLLSRGIDFKDVSVVMQFHPPREASNYLHRAGRTGRAGGTGCCVMLYDSSEFGLVRRVRETTRTKFRMVKTPESGDLHHAAVSRLLDDLLVVQPEEYEVLIPAAKQLLEERGPRVLATAMAILDGRHGDLERMAKQAPSLLTGKAGFVCLLAHDPDQSVASSPDVAQEILLSLLPKRRREGAVGRCVSVQGGWAFDVMEMYAIPLVEELRSGQKSAPFELSVAKAVPRITRVSSRRAKLPWASKQRSANRRHQLRAPGKLRLAARRGLP